MDVEDPDGAEGRKGAFPRFYRRKISGRVEDRKPPKNRDWQVVG